MKDTTLQSDVQSEKWHANEVSLDTFLLTLCFANAFANAPASLSFTVYKVIMNSFVCEQTEQTHTHTNENKTKKQRRRIRKDSVANCKYYTIIYTLWSSRKFLGYLITILSRPCFHCELYLLYNLLLILMIIFRM